MSTQTDEERIGEILEQYSNYIYDLSAGKMGSTPTINRAQARQALLAVVSEAKLDGRKSAYLDVKNYLYSYGGDSIMHFLSSGLKGLTQTTEEDYADGEGR